MIQEEEEVFRKTIRFVLKPSLCVLKEDRFIVRVFGHTVHRSMYIPVHVALYTVEVFTCKGQLSVKGGRTKQRNCRLRNLRNARKSKIFKFFLAGMETRVFSLPNPGLLQRFHQQRGLSRWQTTVQGETLCLTIIFDF